MKSTSRMIKWTFCCVATITAAGVHSAPVLDQQVDPTPFRFDPCCASTLGNIATLFGEEHAAQAQTFTVGLTGRLVSVGAIVFRDSFNESEPLILEIRAVDVNGIPVDDDALVLASINAAPASIPQDSDLDPDSYTIFDLATPLSVAVGQTLALTMRIPRTAEFSNYRWEMSADPNDAYPQGVMYFRSDIQPESSGHWILQGGGDFAFQTYVEPVPLPASVWLFGSAIGAFAARRARTRLIPV